MTRWSNEYVLVNDQVDPQGPPNSDYPIPCGRWFNGVGTVRPNSDPGWSTSSNTHGNCESPFVNFEDRPACELCAQQRSLRTLDDRPCALSIQRPRLSVSCRTLMHELPDDINWLPIKIVDPETAPAMSWWRRFLSTTCVRLGSNCDTGG